MMLPYYSQGTIACVEAPWCFRTAARVDNTVMSYCVWQYCSVYTVARTSERLQPAFHPPSNPLTMYVPTTASPSVAPQVPGYKIIVFFVTARLTGMHAELFNCMPHGYGFKGEVMEIHSRKTQGARTKVSQKFKDCKQGILFTSDVSARGMDYPDVSMVVQVRDPEREPESDPPIIRCRRECLPARHALEPDQTYDDTTHPKQ